MKIMFMHVGHDVSMARMMVDSAKRFDHHLVQLTDTETPAIEGCEIFRMPRDNEGIMYFRAKLYAAYNQPGAYLDTDMCIQRYLGDIMSLDFDVAMTKRIKPIYDQHGNNLVASMPYNGGAVFVKDKTFWPQVMERMAKMPADHQKWYGDQLALKDCAFGRDIVELPCDLYNYTYEQSCEDIDDKWIVHFKGQRKQFMPEYFVHNVYGIAKEA